MHFRLLMRRWGSRNKTGVFESLGRVEWRIPYGKEGKKSSLGGL